ncbi:hypothetical protein O3G_MSEX014942 [Manduca sexta]|uniref:Uncharacterized protein n=1 Tax=Manduca sexta TaxID=7130 RepID=A0A922D0Q7_MANSE|nr:hypothetical protein O3G_MSEX014942 [Manduca sexta]
MSKAIAALKEVVAMYKNAKDQNNKKETQVQNVQNDQIASTSSAEQNAIQGQQTISNVMPQIENLDPKVIQGKQHMNQNETDLDAIKQLVNNGNKSVYENPPPINVEDIEADVEISYHDDINYSPVNSPRPSSLNPVAVTQYSNAEDQRETIERAIYNNDPLNLQDDISFFDDQPVANSSMNVSVKHPLASPWRVEFGRLPIKWPANTYLKANMTPAVESSFISSEDSNKKKHVYVNMIPQENESLPQIVESNPTNLKQTSIISFIREVAERNAIKKKRGKSLSPIKASALFEDVTNRSNADMQKTSKKVTKKAVIARKTNKDVSNSSSNTSNDKDNVRETRKRKNDNAISKLPAKSPRKEKDKDVTYFGFDDSGNEDQENVVPNKNSEHNKVRSLRSRSRVLQEINDKNGPARTALPLAAKTKITSSSEAVKRMYEDLKSAEDAPQLLDKNDQLNAGTTNVDVHQSAEIDNEECDSVHLFEDIDIVHHLKPTRKSYGKAKKVTFRQRSTSDSETQASEGENRMQSSDEDDLADLTFTMPEINQKKTIKKKKTKKLMSKKEEKEADEWAAGFNSMCEDIEEFPLVVE